VADFHRETAIRVFAKEFRDSRVHLPGQGEKDPSYVLTPTGAKVNRLHVVGVCTELDAVGESGDVWRARISDPTGVFTVYAGQYQPAAAEALSNLQPPAFVAVTGKARTYEPEPGTVFVSIRPEAVHEVDEATRDQWILDTARRTTDRLAAAKKGNGDDLALARQHYGDDMTAYRDAARAALEGLLPGGTVQVHEHAGDDGGFTGQGATDAPAWTPPAPAPATNEQEDAFDETVAAIVGRLEGDDGARWDDILQEASRNGATSEDVEESLNRLMDKGLVYEPTLGVLKTT
jgi:hypothetical protein